MLRIKKALQFFVLAIASIVFMASCGSSTDKVLVFSKTAKFRHSSIEAGKKAIEKLAAEHGFVAEFSENADIFAERNLKNYKAVIFLNTTGDVLNANQQSVFERYIQAGGGYVGVHAASDTEYEWPWYGKLVGAYFKDHPPVGKGTLKVLDHKHPSTQNLPDTFEKTDEWYDFIKNPNPDSVHMLVTIDQTTYNHGDDKAHPVAWYHDFDGGKAFYTSMGHTKETYSEEFFLKHLWGGIQYAMNHAPLNYNKVTSLLVPDNGRFSKTMLMDNLNEPTEIAILPDGSIIVVERRGDIKYWDKQADTSYKVGHILVSTKYREHPNGEDGMLGVTADPNFEENNWIYMFYSAIDKEVNRLSRFTFRNGVLNIQSETTILEVPTERRTCCHTGGSLAWDADGNLYISTGDNTNPFGDRSPDALKYTKFGYSPFDQREGWRQWDAQRSAGNTNDLRGKILRIHPEADGSYTIPDGNLFPKNDSLSKAEIYVMGLRNPYRISVDKHTGYLYWGEVGPDAANNDPERGPRGYDELNQARKAGFFGWPLFIGDNYPYIKYDFKEHQLKGPFNPKQPRNTSVHNSGRVQLPPTNPAFIWYPYATSPEFPQLGTGGRNAMSGPIYYYDDFKGKENRLPEFYDKKWFVYDWMRNWIFAVEMDENWNLVKMHPFMPDTKFESIMDMELGPDGQLYLVEYGTGWFTKNPGAALFRIDYNENNSPPSATLVADTEAGALPLKVNFTVKDIYDGEADKMHFTWMVDGNTKLKTEESTASFSFTLPGKHEVSVLLDDGNGGTYTAKTEVYAGNAAPEVNIELSGNKTFYWPDGSLQYQVKVSDKEDGNLDKGVKPEDVMFRISYLPGGMDKAGVAQGHQEVSPALLGKSLIAAVDCKNCHAVDKAINGPSFTQIAEHYKDDGKAVDKLADKIINGGSGVWGDRAMAAHPDIPKADAQKMVKYILSLSGNAEQASLPLSGTFNVADKYQSGNDKGVFYLHASYLDKGAGSVGPLSGVDALMLRYPKFSNEKPDFVQGMKGVQVADKNYLQANESTAYFGWKNIDLTGVGSLHLEADNLNGWKVEVHAGKPDGQLLGTSSGDNNIILKALNKKTDLYIVLKGNTGEDDNNRPLIKWLEFNR